MARLWDEYRNRVVRRLMERFKYKNPLQAPRLKKIVINVGLGEAVSDSKVIDLVKKDLATITGQLPVPTRAKRPISNFRIRKGMIIGLKVTLRRKRMYEFYDRFINFVAPRIRDFRGFSPDSFDGRGNYTLGLSEQTVFPEIEYDKVKMIFGMDITFVTTAETDEEARALFEEMGFPFAKKRR
ncbi:50S ribosomal protein L5 [candidate division WOR-3 bacterium]|uniref:Large ribosomal subunit protein uL5 n=1 Tax=candidate division WOR-3 bacterium TaxID=2052148 RepID=A0A660SCF3_UNCW3|nr:MAG: 50S ribosomal protein L5 [candidate division WOR-3 bacterium]